MWEDKAHMAWVLRRKSEHLAMVIKEEYGERVMRNVEGFSILVLIFRAIALSLNPHAPGARARLDHYYLTGITGLLYIPTLASTSKPYPV